MKQKMKKIYIGCTMVVLVALLGVAAWLITRNTTKENVQTAKNELGIEWYDENETEFTITTMEELYDIAALSMYYDFAGQTIKLGADIVDNEGNAAEWKDMEPENLWESIYGFAGTFDGQGHTISGIYCRAELYFANIDRVQGLDYVTAGLFRSTQEECVIKNLKVINSYFESDLDYGAAVISSNGGGTFDNIYTDSIILSQKSYVGGIIGRITEPTKITNCWFDGSIEIVGGYGRCVGGIAGRVQDKSDTVIEHCLVSGDLSNDVYKAGVNMGGILGISVKSEVEITDCLVTGTLHNEWITVGSVVGNVATDSTTTIKDVYTCEESFEEVIGILEDGKLQGMPVVYERDRYVGYGGYQWTTLDFENYWTVVDGGTPILQAFATEKPSLDGIAKKMDISWYNEQEDTYVLMDVEDFYGFAILSNSTNFEGKTIKLGADIKLNDGKASTWKKEAPANKWLCIGSKNYPFAGTFDGQMHTISGVYLKANAQYSGLFGVTTQSAVVKRFKLVNSYFESDKLGIGSIAGQAIGIFDTIYSDAIVTGNKSSVGGMIGRATEKKDSTIKMTNCWFDGTVTNTGNTVDDRWTGGLIGFVVIKADFSNCLNSGTVNVRSYTVPNDAKSEHVQPYAGGLVGYVYGSSKTTITDCMNTGDILMSDAVTSAAGSILGYSSGTTTISNTYVTKESSKFTTRGNIVGNVISFDKAQITGYGGYQWTGLDFNKYWAVVLDDTSVLKSFAKSVPSLASVERKADISWYNAKDDVFVLSDAADLRGFALLSKANDFKGKTVKLANDIALNSGDASTWSKTAPETEWMSIGTVDTRFAGTFDGQMHTISGVYMNTDEKYTGLFSGTDDEAVVKNFRLTNSYFYSSEQQIGSIVGNARGTFDGIYSDAIIESANNVAGGLIGSTSSDGGVKITNCWFDGEVTNVKKAASYYAGILAWAYRDSTITNCINTGTITCELAKQPRMGGIFGGMVRSDMGVDISYCLNAGEIKHGKSTKEQGLLVGYAYGKVNVENSYSIAQGTDTLVATKANKLYPTCGAAGSFEDTKGTAALANAAGLFVKKNSDGKYENNWVAVIGSVPVPKKLLAYTSGEQFTPDVSWYDNSKEYTLKTKEQLFGAVVLSYLSDVDGFAGKTIKLGADITINEGNADDWKQNAPKYGWGSIGDSTAKFKGNFDGQKHTISGVYQNTTKQCQGLFGDITGDVKIANFSLINSCFNRPSGHEYAFFGAVAGRASGTFENIYVDAIVDSSGRNTAGFVGATGGKLTIINCWNAGPVSSEHRYIGGMVGYVDKATTLKNCLNTGAITSTYANTSATANYSVAIGGFLGSSIAGSGLYNCLNLGSVNYTKTNHSVGYGMIVGSLGSTTFQDLFTIKQDGVTDFFYSSSAMNSTNVTKINSLDDIKGTKALINMTKLFTLKTSDDNYESYWSILPNGAPVLTSFAKYAGEKHIAIDTSWYKVEDATYKLKNISDLYGFAVLSYKTNFAGKTIKLDSDIEVNKGKATATGWDKTKAVDGSDITNGTDYLWLPIGSTSIRFNGEFDGQMHTISGIYLNSTSAYQGMFSGTDTNAEIKNLYLKNSYFTTTNVQLGSIVGNAKGTSFEKIYSDAIVAGNGGCAKVGGMIGSTSDAGGVTMDECWFAGSATINGAASYLGGLIGYVVYDSTITNCLNTGVVDHKYRVGTAAIGGFVGCVYSGRKISISDSVNHSNITRVSGLYFGLFVGYPQGTVNLTNCHSVNYTGKQLIGNANEATDTSSQYTTCSRQNKTAVAGLKSLTTNKVKELFLSATAKGHWAVTKDSLPVLAIFAENAKVTAQAVDTSWYDASKTEFTLMDSGDLYGLALLSQSNTFAGKDIKLGADITVNKDIENPDFEWMSIGTSGSKFQGDFDGQMHTISGIYLNTDRFCLDSTNKQLQGFFGDITGNVRICNFSLTDSIFYRSGGHAYAFFGAVAGRASGTFENIYLNANVQSSGRNTAGFVGATSGALTLINCWNAGPVSSSSTYTGSMVGYTEHIITMRNCLNTGKISTTSTSSSPYIGGFLGRCIPGSGLYNCFNVGEVDYNKTTATSYYGSMIGQLLTTGRTTFDSLYTIKQEGLSDYNGSSNSASVTKITSLDDVKGDNASGPMEKLLAAQKENGESYWSIVPDGHSVLTTFINKTTSK